MIMKKFLQLFMILAFLGSGIVFAQTGYSDTVAFGNIDQVGGTYPSTNWTGVAGEAFPFTQQFVYTAESGVEGSPESVNVDVTMKIDANKQDEETGEILDSLMYINLFQTVRLVFAGEPSEGLSVPNGDMRQFNHDEVFSFIFESVNNTPPNDLYPDVQMSLYGVAGWAWGESSFDIYLNGERVGMWQKPPGNGNAIEPVITDLETRQPIKVVITEGDTIQFKGHERDPKITYFRLNSLVMVMEATVPPTAVTLTAEGGSAEITENNGSLRILGDIAPETSSVNRIEWTLENNDIGATINNAGIVQAWPRDAGNGTVTVKGTAGDVSSTLEVTISGQEDILVDSIYVNSWNDSITENGGTLRMQAEVFPDLAANKDVVWTVDDAGTGATIDETGLLRGGANDNGNGTVIVMATAADGSEVSDTMKVHIINQETVFVESIEITFDGDFAEILENAGTLQLNAAVLPELASDKSVTWSLEGDDLGATIDENGLLTASGLNDGNGVVTVKATANDGSGVSSTLVVTIANQSNVSVPQTELQKAVSVYPNPVNGNQKLVLEISENVAVIEAIQVFDISGRKVTEITEFSGNPYRTELSFNKEKGIYLIKVNTDKGSVIRRALVK